VLFCGAPRGQRVDLHDVIGIHGGHRGRPVRDEYLILPGSGPGSHLAVLQRHRHHAGEKNFVAAGILARMQDLPEAEPPPWGLEPRWLFGHSVPRSPPPILVRDVAQRASFNISHRTFGARRSRLGALSGHVLAVPAPGPHPRRVTHSASADPTPGLPLPRHQGEHRAPSTVARAGPLSLASLASSPCSPVAAGIPQRERPAQAHERPTA